jgi:hypothetical protein
MATWETSKCVETRPDRIIGLLTDPDAAERWSPVAFELRKLDGERLYPGARVELAGRIAGREVTFEVDVLQADDSRFAIRARGPFEIDAAYHALPRSARTELRASVSVRSAGGLRGRLVSAAAEALLAAGVLDATVARIASEAAAPAG